MNDMKLRLTVVLALFISITALAQNKMDAEGKRDGKWQGTYPSKRLRYEGTFDHGKETGTFKFYEDTEGSPLMASREFATDGSCVTVFYDAKGKKASEGKEVNKMQEGEWKFYHPSSGKLVTTETYSKGKLSGIRKIYYPEGMVAEEMNFSNGMKNGPYKKYSPKGVVMEESAYKDDKLQGPVTYRDEDNKVICTGQFAANKKTGVWKYFEKGKLVKQENMTNKKVELATRPVRPAQ